jgi:tetratricopeptide (TPR) repeat protein
VALYRYWYWRSHFREGVRWLEAFLAVKSTLPPTLNAQALYAAGVLAAEQNDYKQAKSYLEESLALRQGLEDKQGQAACLNSLGIVAWSQQAYRKAKSLLEKSLALRRELGETNLGPVLNSLGLVALAEGEYREAEIYFKEQLQETRKRKHNMGTAIGLSNLGASVLEQARLAEACTHFLESLKLFQNLEDREGIAWCLEGLAAAAIRKENPECATALCASASTLRQQIHAPLTSAERPRFERTVAEACSALGEQGFTMAWDRGQEMSLEAIIAWAVTMCD